MGHKLLKNVDIQKPRHLPEWLQIVEIQNAKNSGQIAAKSALGCSDGCPEQQEVRVNTMIVARQVEVGIVHALIRDFPAADAHAHGATIFELEIGSKRTAALFAGPKLAIRQKTHSSSQVQKWCEEAASSAFSAAPGWRELQPQNRRDGDVPEVRCAVISRQVRDVIFKPGDACFPIAGEMGATAVEPAPLPGFGHRHTQRV